MFTFSATNYQFTLLYIGIQPNTWNPRPTTLTVSRIALYVIYGQGRFHVDVNVTKTDQQTSSTRLSGPFPEEVDFMSPVHFHIIAT